MISPELAALFDSDPDLVSRVIDKILAGEYERAAVLHDYEARAARMDGKGCESIAAALRREARHVALCTTAVAEPEPTGWTRC